MNEYTHERLKEWANSLDRQCGMECHTEGELYGNYADAWAAEVAAKDAEIARLTARVAELERRLADQLAEAKILRDTLNWEIRDYAVTRSIKAARPEPIEEKSNHANDLH